MTFIHLSIVLLRDSIRIGPFIGVNFQNHTWCNLCAVYVCRAELEQSYTNIKIRDLLSDIKTSHLLKIQHNTIQPLIMKHYNLQLVFEAGFRNVNTETQTKFCLLALYLFLSLFSWLSISKYTHIPFGYIFQELACK